jgi:hypothetical protein
VVVNKWYNFYTELIKSYAACEVYNCDDKYIDVEKGTVQVGRCQPLPPGGGRAWLAGLKCAVLILNL